MNQNKIKLLIDMDDTLCDFSGSQRLHKKGAKKSCEEDPVEMYEPGFFETMAPIPGALEAVRRLYRSDKYDIYICSQPLALSIFSYQEKAAWIAKHIPYLLTKLILLQDKTMVRADILIDDNPKWAHVAPNVIRFPYENYEIAWAQIVKQLLGEY